MIKKSIDGQIISTWLDDAIQQLVAVGIDSAHLDAEIILAHTLRKSRTYLHAHSDDILEPRVQEIADARLSLRLDHVPIAYLIGSREFYGRDFIITPDVLIPRSETETLIDCVKALTLLESPTIHDVATGSGCIAVTLALELPSASVSASDISPTAVTIARKNATTLGAKVSIRTDDLMKTHYTTGGLDVIVANLPYVDQTWETSPETAHEPSIALFAKDHGLELIKKLIIQASTRLLPRGYLVLEADPCQHNAITSYAQNHGFRSVENRDYILVLQKI